ncbi:hypothetical protein ANCDUO_09942 [Ancylostoma duodenale]|uniref:Uncharacterized protein n=1 Tax=Ancylostoma duodenale TaxID=51022 RepID=A0A0C2GLJ5_9BILA|nr:hypothetical protein ANCDUO_09942 [Ancylostoma duodenale]
MIYLADEGSSIRPRYKSYFHATKCIIRAEGIRGLYQGLTPNMYETKSTKKYSGMVDCLLKILKEEGIPGLYRGFVPGLIGTTHGALQFMIYNRMKGSQDYLVFSALSKTIATTVTFPYQVLRTRMQDHNVQSGGVWRTTVDTVRREGFRGLYKGCIMANLRQLPAAVVTFVTYENVRRYISVIEN